MDRKTQCHEGDPLPASWSRGTGGGEARGIVSRASSHRRMAVQSGLDICRSGPTLIAAAKWLRSSCRAENDGKQQRPKSTLAQTYLPALAPRATRTPSGSWTSKNAPEWKQRRPLCKAPWVQSSDMPWLAPAVIPGATAKSFPWLDFLDRFSRRRVYLRFEFVSFYYFQSERQTLSLSGHRRAGLIARLFNEAYPLRPKSWAALLVTALRLPVL
jgi:hypothetical protein